MPRYAPNKMSTAVKKRYFELLREGYKGAAAARIVGVSTSCGSLWFIDAGSVNRAKADGLQAGFSKKQIVESIGKGFQTVYREVTRNSRPDGRYQP